MCKLQGPTAGFNRAGVGFYFGDLVLVSVTLQQTKIVIVMKEEIIYVVDSLGVSHPETIQKAGVSLPSLFVEGGMAGMIVITLLLVALFIAAWKAPKWVKEIGIGALVVGIFWSLLGLLQALDTVHSIGYIGMGVLCGGFKVCLIATLYGLIVYFVSLIIRVIQKPRI